MYFYPDERFAVFIDGTNLYLSARNLNFDIDYQKLHKWFRDQKGIFLRALYYTALHEDNQDFSPIRPLVDWLDYNGYMVVTKPLKEFHDPVNNRPRYKGNMDGEMIVDLITMSDSLAHVVLFSGDGDFRAVIGHLQRQGKRVTVISTLKTQPPMAADELRRQADQFIELDDLRPSIERAALPGGPRGTPAHDGRNRP